MTVEVVRVSKRFGAHVALDDVSLSVAEGALVVLLGPSGSGKTTLLRVLAGLEQPDAGRVAFGGADAARMPPRDRRVGFVFQHHALFGHLSVFENVAFGLRVLPRRRRPDRAELRRRVLGLLDLVQLPGFEARRPAELSGGQRQRVALARALAVDPRVLLLDEPFGALDAGVRRALRTSLRRLHRDVGVTTVLVTHDQDEAFELADRVAVLRDGRIEQVGTPTELRAEPATAFVRSFLDAAVREVPRAAAGG
jgi:sulfate transport system ATP-binding protein